MANDNSVFVIGNCTRDPELRYTTSGQAVANFGLAYNKRKRSADGSWEDGDPAFFDIACWGQLAENVCETIQKGTRVLVTGRLDQRSWENQEGEKRSKVEIVADEVSPSLRWATAEVTRNEKRSDGGGGGGGGARGGSAASSGASASAGSYDDDEEPF